MERLCLQAAQTQRWRRSQNTRPTTWGPTAVKPQVPDCAELAVIARAPSEERMGVGPGCRLRPLPGRSGT